MKKIVYLHGFSSAGSTGTATNLRNHLYADYGVTVVSPDIPVSPAEAVPFIKKVIEEENPDLIIGTSMGGMYTELLHGHLRICVNPSFHMARLLTFKHLGKNVEFQNKRADGQKQFKVDKKMVAEFKEIETKLTLKNITPDAQEHHSRRQETHLGCVRQGRPDSQLPGGIQEGIWQRAFPHH